MEDEQVVSLPEVTRPFWKRPFWKKLFDFLIKNTLIFALLAALIIGICTGILMRINRSYYSMREVMYVGFLGTLYIRALKLMTVPLIIASIITSLTNISLRFAGMLGLRTFLFFLATTFLAAVWGIILVFCIAPGKENTVTHNLLQTTTLMRRTTIVDAILDLIRSVFPPNLVEAWIRSYRTELFPPLNLTLMPDGTFITMEDKSINKYEWNYTTNKFSRATNYLGICAVSIAFGISAVVTRSSTEVIREVFEAFNEVVISIVTIIIWTSPVGVFSLLAAKIIEEKDYRKFVGQVAWYSLTVLTGIVTYGFLFLPFVYVVFTRKNPITFTFNMIEAVTTGFATASSLVALPVTTKCVIEKNHIPATVARFVVPLGATVNMNGTALYEAVAPIFIAQAVHIQLTVMQVIFTTVVATLASIGSAGIPQAGLVTMVMVLNTFNLETEHIVYIIAVDWVLDRFRTALNIFGDAVGAAVVFSMCKKEFRQTEMDEMAVRQT